MTLLLLLALAQPRIDLASLAGPCDERALMRTFHERLDSLSPSHPPADAVVSLRFRSDGYQVELVRPGRVPVRRSLSAAEGDCSLVAELAALVVERWLRALPPPSPAPMRAPELSENAPPPHAPAVVQQEAPAAAPATAPAVEEPVHAPAIPQPTAAAAEPESAPSFALSAGGAGLLGRGGQWQPGFQVQLARRTESWSFALSIAAATGQPDIMRQPGPRGFGPGFSQETALAALSASRCVGDWLRTCVGPYAGVRWSGATASPEMGGSLGIDLALSSRLHFGLSLLGGTSLGDRANPSLTAAASLGLLVF